jgi:trk system potassium uptake protein TrkA
VTIVETEPDRGAVAGAEGLHTVFGDAIVPATLEHAGALTADVLVASTRSDEDNLVISLLAKRLFSVPRVIARVNDLANSWMFDETWGVDTVVSPAALLKSIIEQEPPHT